MRDEIEAEAAAARVKAGAMPLGRRAILAQHPHHQPETMKKSPKPRIHAASRAARWWFYEGYSWFVAAYRTAAAKLRAGDRMVVFRLGASRRRCRLWAGDHIQAFLSHRIAD